MAQFEFEELADPQVPGITLRSKKGTGVPETGVYLPPKHQPKTLGLNVLLWLHGFYVRDIADLVNPTIAKTDPSYKGDAKVRQAVLDADEDVVVIAPFLGYVDKNFNGTKAYGAGSLGRGTGCRDYLLQVLVGLSLYLKARFKDQGPHGKADVNKEMESNPNWLRGGGPLHRLDIENLYVACHSGGGYGAMIGLVNALGRFDVPVLKECWGFDCLYPSDWVSFCQSHTDVDLYFYYGKGTMGPDARATIFQLAQKAYGTPTQPKPASMRRVKLAPTFMGVETDHVAFKPTDYYQKLQKPATTYEEMRKTLDPLLDNQGKYWQTFDANQGNSKLMTHYGVVQALLSRRIKTAMHGDTRAP